MVKLTSESEIKKLIKYMVDNDEGSETCLKFGCDILINMIQRTSANDRRYSDSEEVSEDSAEDIIREKVDPATTFENLPPHIRILGENIPRLCELMVKPPVTKFITTPEKIQIEAYGLHRIKIMELFLALVNLNYEAVTNLFLKNELISRIIELFLKFEKNNFCHKLTEDFFLLLFSLRDDKILELLKNTQLLQNLANGYQDIKKLETDKRYRPQNAPYILNIAQKIKNLELEELHEIKEKSPAWNDMEKDIDKITQELSDFQQSQKINNEKPELDDDFDYQVHEGDDKDYDIELGEILLTKQEIEID